MASAEKLSTHQKALEINLDATSYGSFAEIGAGQEVVRWFLIVGGASGTVAKAISAYDKEVSDDLYGAGERYVSKERLEAMLDSEWTQLLNQLNKSRGSSTRFFSFVDTIAARNYAGTNEPHGWVGLRFQLQPGGPPNEIVLHINLRDGSNLLEQEAIGILGVNLLYAAFHQLEAKESFFQNVAQGVETRIEIDYVEVRGTAFEGWDQRAILADLVLTHLAQAVYFPSSGSLEPPVDVLHKKCIVFAPGFFEHIDPAHAAINEQMLEAGVQQLRKDSGEKDPTIIGLFCISATPLTDSEAPPKVPDLLTRIDALQKRGGDVLLFRERELYNMTDFVNRYTTEHVRFVMRMSLFVRVWEYRYTKFAGSFLEALSRLFAQNVRIYAFPVTSQEFQQSLQTISAPDWQWSEVNGWVSARDLHPLPPFNYLYDYLLASNFLIPMEIPAASKTPE